MACFYYVRFAALVDGRLSDGLNQNARIYAALPADAQFQLDASPLMATFFDRSRARRRVVEFTQIPDVLIKAILSGEDRQFLNHHGVSPRRIAGAFVSNMRQGARTQGGSTITQQLARSLFLNREPTLRRKLSEAFIAVILETRLTKQQILAAYINEVYLGQRDSFAIHGFAEASRDYFGKDLEDLTLSEAAMLAGIIPAPNTYSPVHHPDRAEIRRNLILSIMLASGDITNAEYKQALHEKLIIAPQSDPTEGQYLVDYIQEELLQDFSEETLMNDGMSVYTTVDLQLQKAAMDSVEYGLKLVNAELGNRRKASGSKESAEPEAGLIALDPATGEIKAMVGGTRYGGSQYNRVTQALRQPGSVFKPFVYAAALETAFQHSVQTGSSPYEEESSGLITPLTVLMDEPAVFNSGGKDYAPKNYKEHYLGAVTLRTALQRSLNIPTVRLAQSIGYDRVVRLALRLGMNPRIKGYPSVALGAFEVTPIEIAGAYTAFANGGQLVHPHAIRRVVAADRRVLKTYEFQPQAVLSPQIAYLMTHLLEEVINQGTGAGVRARGFTLPAAGKTGTSRDGWFAGYTKDLLVIAWVGFDDGHDLNLEGAHSALPIWAEFMKKAYQIHPPKDPASMRFDPPQGIEMVSIDSATLQRGDPECGGSFIEAFLTGTAPAGSCLDLVPVEVPEESSEPVDSTQ